MSEITTASPALVSFTAAFEGMVHRAYRDAGGVVTIGNGFTNLSQTFSTWWKQHHGHALRMGDTISDAECDLLLGRLLNEEYAPPVAKRFAGLGLGQNEFDAATDVCFNCGAGSLKWSWAGELAARAVAAAAARLRATAVTAGGRRLKGLERRRAAEARLLESGDYGLHPSRSVADAPSSPLGASGKAPSAATTREEIKTCQAQLAALSLYKGAIDGIADPATLAAVRNFQRAGGLVVDGVVGPATRAALARAVNARRAGQATGGSAVTAGAIGGGSDFAHDPSAFDGSTLLTVGVAALIVAALVLAGFALWRYRGVILGRRTAA